MWSKKSEGCRPDLYGEEPKVPKISIMIWGCITSNGVGTLYMTEENINAVHYLNILDENLWPVMLKEFPAGDGVFQQDNASVHTAHIIRDFMREGNIKMLPCPVKSPDLNIIKNLWFMLKFDIKSNIERINNFSDLKTIIRECWNGISKSYVRTLYNSIPRRLRAVQISKGHLTKY